jgi:hypothetical protein
MMDDDYLEVDEGPRQPPWFLLTGLVLGLIIGLLFSLAISPVRYTDTSPASLAPEYKDNYRWLIARAYQANGDLVRARQRLALLEDTNPQEALAAQAQRMLAEGQDVEKARLLAVLSSALSSAAEQPAQVSSPVSLLTSVPGTQQPFATLDIAQAVLTATALPGALPTIEPSRTPIPTFTQRTSPTTLPTLGAPFVLDSQSEICDPTLPQGLMQIELKDERGQPVPGIQIHVAWDGGLDSFYTGLKPSISSGYADFVMSAGVVYSLRVGDGGETIKNLSAPQCDAADQTSYLGGLRLEFSQR